MSPSVCWVGRRIGYVIFLTSRHTIVYWPAEHCSWIKFSVRKVKQACHTVLFTYLNVPVIRLLHKYFVKENLWLLSLSLNLPNGLGCHCGPGSWVWVRSIRCWLGWVGSENWPMFMSGGGGGSVSSSDDSQSAPSFSTSIFHDFSMTEKWKSMTSAQHIFPSKWYTTHECIPELVVTVPVRIGQ